MSETESNSLTDRARFLASGQDDVHSVTITELCDEIDRLTRKLTNRRYMLEAYRLMLSPTGVKVAKMWEEKGVQRVHHDWTGAGMTLSGEERAQHIMEWENAPKRQLTPEELAKL